MGYDSTSPLVLRLNHVTGKGNPFPSWMYGTCIAFFEICNVGTVWDLGTGKGNPLPSWMYGT